MRPSYVEKLKSLLGPDRVLADAASLMVYAYDGALEKRVPGAVALPRDAGQVAALVLWAADAGVPFTARGAGTNLCGASVPSSDGLVIHLSGMNRILSIDPAGRVARVEPGVVNRHLNDALLPFGLFYAPDPASWRASTLGGNVGTNAGGPRCLKYGVTTTHIRGLDVVLPDGSQARVSLQDPGYDLTALLVGSEGTLGIVTAVEAALLPIPGDTRTLLVSFPSLESAAQSVTDVTAAGIVPAALEFLDRFTLGTVEAFVKAGYPTDVEAVLLVETDGFRAAEDMDRIREFCSANGGRDPRLAVSAAERDKLWEGRRGAYAALARVAPNVLVEDGVVPRSKLPDAVRRVRAVADRERMDMGLIAHAGDGNLHPNIAYDERDRPAASRVHAAGQEMMRICVDLGGSISGEHGIGTEKRAAMSWLFTPGTLRLFRRVKEAFDPRNLCNPDKLLPLADVAPPLPSAAEGGGGFPGLEERDTVVVESAERLTSLLWYARLNRRPVFLQGLGTRNLRAPTGALTLELHGLNKLIHHDKDNFTVTVQAGMSVSALAKRLESEGRFAALAGGGTVGGLLSSGGVDGASLRDHVLQVKAVLSVGDTVTVGAPVMKSVAGYDLAKLFVGAWGTLGAVLEVTLRTFPRPLVVSPRRTRPDVAAFGTPVSRRVRGAFDPENIFAAGVPRGR